MGGKLSKEGFQKHYTIGAKLGEGSFAEVKRVTRKKDGAKFAVKVIKKSKLQKSELSILHDEVTIMHKIDHPNCVKLYEIYETKKKLYMVLELLTGGELFDRILDKGSYSEKEAADLVRSIITAIKYLHSIGIVHRDLKPENLIYAGQPGEKNEHLVKITDFGLAKYKAEPNDAMSTACGTPGYVAPEVLQNRAYGPPVDLWSMGVILYILLCGFPPFYSAQTSQLYKQIKKGQFEFPAPYWDEVSEDAKSLVCGLLTVDPKKRLTPDGVLSHPWITGSASDKDFSDAHHTNLKLLRARLRLKKGVRSIIAVNRFAKCIANLENGER